MSENKSLDKTAIVLIVLTLLVAIFVCIFTTGGAEHGKEIASFIGEVTAYFLIACLIFFPIKKLFSILRPRDAKTASDSLAADAKMIFKCPHCGKEIKGPKEYIGRQVECPICGADFTLESFNAVRTDLPMQESSTVKDSEENTQRSHAERNGSRFMIIAIAIVVGLAFLFGWAWVCRWEITTMPNGVIVRTNRWTGKSYWTAYGSLGAWRLIKPQKESKPTNEPAASTPVIPPSTSTAFSVDLSQLTDEQLEEIMETGRILTDKERTARAAEREKAAAAKRIKRENTANGIRSSPSDADAFLPPTDVSGTPRTVKQEGQRASAGGDDLNSLLD